VAVLITSRGPLPALEGAKRLQLGALDPTQALELFKNFLGDARTELEPEAASEIVDLCGRLPLAMRIAGARVSMRPSSRLADYAESLRDEKGRLDELKVGDLEVRASLRLAYQACSTRERHVFQLLGELNSPTFSDWAVAALAKSNLRDGRSLLEGLLDAQLVEVTGSDPLGGEAYRLQDLTRLFAREQSTRKTSLAGRREALDVYFSVALEHASRADLAIGYDHPRCAYVNDTATRLGTDATLLEATERPLGWFMAKSTELTNAVEKAYDLKQWDYVWRLAVSTAGYFWLRGQLHDWERAHDLGLEAARRQRSLAGEAYILANQGELYRRQRRWEDSYLSLHRAIELFRELDYTLEEAQTVHTLGVWYEKRERWRESVEQYEHAFALFRSLGYTVGQAYSLISLGFVCRRRNQLDEAAEYFRRAQSVASAAGDPLAEANALRGMADVLREKGSWTAALEWYNRCLPVVRELGDRRAEAYVFLYMSHISVILKRTREVSAQLEQCLHSFQTLGDRVGEAHTFFTLGELYQQKGRLDQAAVYYRSSLDIYRELGYVKRKREALSALVTSLDATGRRDEAQWARQELQSMDLDTH
jgi:tetratricopeptide (TPR) repeat protein